MAVSQALTVTEVANSQSVANNTSKVRILWQSIQTGPSYNGNTRTAYYWVSINGGAETKYSLSYTLPSATTKTILDTTITVTHKDDGSGTVKVRTWMDTDISAGVVEQSQTLTLTTIARASTISSASNVTLGNACSVKWTPKSKDYYYKLVFALGDFTKTITGIAPKTTSAYTYTGYKIPIDGVAQEITDNPPKGTMKVTLTTHTASSCTSANQIGSADAETFTVTVPENSSTKPTVSMTLSPVSALEAPFDSLYIKGKTKVQASFTGSGKYGADIDSYKVSVDGKSYGSPYKSSLLSTIGDITITGTATDSRGFTNTDKETITVIDYGAPTLLPVSGEKAIVCGRCDKDGNLTTSGTSLKIRAKRNYSKVMADGVQNNFCIIRYRIIPEGSKFSDDTGWVTILEKSAASDEVTMKIAGVVASVETAYIVQVGVIDDVGESAAIQFPIPTDFVTVDIPENLKGRRIGFLRYAQDSNEPGIDVGAPIYGGSIDSLKLGTLLAATETTPISLNDYKTPGCYYSPNAANSQYITDSPYTEGGFGLTVRELQASNYIRQELFYGRTTWIRHYNGSEWSEWWRYQTTTVAEKASADYVIESETSGVWTYEKWVNGKAVCWGTLGAENSWASGTSVFGTATVNYSALSAAFPALFVSVPTVFVTANDSGDGVVTSSNDLSTAETCKIIVFGNKTAISSANVYAIGRWK